MLLSTQVQLRVFAFFIMFVLISSERVSAQSLTWQDISSPAALTAVALAQGPTGNLYAATRNHMVSGDSSSSGGILRSSDNGKSWRKISTGKVADSSFTSMTVTASGFLFAGTLSGGHIYRTLNNGTSWLKFDTAFAAGTSCWGLVSTGTGHTTTTWAATSNGAYRSTNVGNTWDEINTGLTSVDLRHIVRAPNGTLFVGTASSDRGIFRSTDNGDLWEWVGAPLQTGVSVSAIATGANGDIYVGSSPEVYRSTDNGTTWAVADTGIDLSLITAILPIAPDTLLVAANNSVYRSSPSGWVQVSGESINTLLRSADGSVFAGTNLGIQKSTNLGDSWMTVYSGMKDHDIYTLAISPSDQVFAGGHGGFYQYEPDSLNYWIQLNENLPIATLSAMVVDSSIGCIAALGPRGGVYRSTNDGQTWSKILEDSSNSQEKELYFDRPRGTVYFAGYGTGLLRTTDAGSSWDQIYTSDSVTAILATISGQFIIGIGGGQIARSIDNGATWTVESIQNSTVRDFKEDLQTGYLFAATDNGFFRSADAGNNWELLGGGLPSDAGVKIFVSSAGKVFAGCSNLGVFSSTDSGTTWQEENQGLTNKHIYDIALDSTGYLYVATANGVFRSSQEILTAVDSDHYGLTLPSITQLRQNYPNPFNPTTTISYSLPSSAFVTLTITNVLGQVVSIPVNAKQDAGEHAIQWNGAGYPSGIYFYRLQAGSFTETKKLLLVK